MRKILVKIILIFALFTTKASAEYWPTVRELDITVGIWLNAEHNRLDVPIYDDVGSIRYRLFCMGGDDNFQEFLPSNLTGQFLWPLTCVLSPGPEHGSASLLSTDQVNGPYQTRGYFSSRDFTGTKLEFPEFGRVRHFRLRGFELTLEIKNIQKSEEVPNEVEDFQSSVEYFDLRISVRRDSNAKGARSGQPGYYLDCQTGDCELRQGFQKLMCRNPTVFSWEGCSGGYEFDPFIWEINPFNLVKTPVALKRRGRQVEALQQAMLTRRFPELLIEEVVTLLRRASQEGQGDILKPILPATPFYLFCASRNGENSEAKKVVDMSEWNLLWSQLVSNGDFADFSDLMIEDAALSSSYAVNILQDKLYIQKGLLVRTSVACSELGINTSH